YLELLFVVLAIALSPNRSPGRLLFILLIASFTALFTGEAVFNAYVHKPGNFTRSALTYVFLNALLFVLFAYDVVRSHLTRRTVSPARDPEGLIPARPSGFAAVFSAFAPDVAAFAILCFIAAALLDLLDTRYLLGLVGIHLGGPYVTVDLNTLFGMQLPT